MDWGRLVPFALSFFGSLLGGALASATVSFFVADYAISRHESALASTFEVINSRLESIDSQLGSVTTTLAEVQLRAALIPDPSSLEAISEVRTELNNLFVTVAAQGDEINNLLFLLTLVVNALGVPIEQ